ncbi:MAG: ubiquinol-cytochrome c reductase iron-sulfur subunit [Caldilinea sp. CFX5]|nr:ubiquinol-cytochrome c reductase iron-sulfur subunit [Caldilinea sp. CFX5]
MISNTLTNQGTISGKKEQLVQPINRREFLLYTWGAALTLLSLEGLGVSYLFLAPRFRAGEFGGKFPIGEAPTLPATTDAPQANSAGKFWLINTPDGPKALYMVCTHLGCLYKWEAQANYFRCPCHGSTFSREGDYICGPAPRSLDQFVIEIVQNEQIIANTTTTANESIQPPTTIPTGAQLIVNTGKRLRGQASVQSPVRAQGVCETR